MARPRTTSERFARVLVQLVSVTQLLVDARILLDIREDLIAVQAPAEAASNSTVNLVPALPSLSAVLTRSAVTAEQDNLQSLTSKATLITRSADANRAFAKASLRAHSEDGPWPSVESLNKKVLHIREEIDSLLLDCSSDLQTKQEQLSVTSSEVSYVTAEISSNAAQQLEVSAANFRNAQLRDKLKGDLDKMEWQCATSVNNSKTQAELLKGDMNSMQGMQQLVADCKASLLLVQDCDGEASWRPATSSLRHQASLLATSAAKASFQEVLLHAAAREWPGKPEPKMGYLRKRDPSACEQNRSVEVDCGYFGEGVHSLVGHLEEKLRDNTKGHRDIDEKCQHRVSQAQAQVADARRIQGQSSVELSRVMESLSSLQAERDATQREQDALVSEIKDKDRECRRLLSTLESEAGNALQMREAVRKHENGGKAGDPIQDCQVSDWVSSPCSQKCRDKGGEPGNKTLTRGVLLAPQNGGLACPPLQAKVACGRSRCPRDCKMGEWQPWQSCSKPCDGGTQSRARSVVTRPANGGKRCQVAEMRRVCNLGSCAVDCELEEWTDWSTCSRGCRYNEGASVGQQERVRKIKVPASNFGVCADEHSIERFDSRRCNDFPCPANTTCSGNQDILIMFQGGEKTDFAAQLALARGLVNRSASTVRFGALAYGATSAVLTGITDHKGMLDALEAASLPKGNPDMAQGEAVARNLLLTAAAPAAGGEANKQVVLLVTDGASIEYAAALTAARSLTETGARLMVALVEKDRSEEVRERVCDFVGKPCGANVEAVDEWETIGQQTGRFLAAVCNHLDLPPQPTFGLLPR